MSERNVVRIKVVCMDDFAARLERRCREPTVANVIRVVGQTPAVRCCPPPSRSGAIALRLGMSDSWTGRLDTALVVWRDETPDMQRAKQMLRRVLRRGDTSDVLLVTPHPEHDDFVRQLAISVAVVKGGNG